MFFDIFSKRGKALPDVFQYVDLPERFRNQVIWLFGDTFGVHAQSGGYSDSFVAEDVMGFVKKVICSEHGLPGLTGKQDAVVDVSEFFLECDDVGISLDIIEQVFFGLSHHATSRPSVHLNTSTFPKFVDTLNHRFRENGLGYEFNIDALQIIRVDNQAIHQSAIQPALQVLAAREYTHANAELIAAFNDYKKGDYPDCLVKCCSAMESVLKVIIKRERWGGNEVDKETAGPLIARFRNQTGLDSFFEQPLILIANLRNKISPAHGAGDKPKIVPQHFAHYALNATTSAILLLDDHAKYAKSAAGP